MSDLDYIPVIADIEHRVLDILVAGQPLSPVDIFNEINKGLCVKSDPGFVSADVLHWVMHFLLRDHKIAELDHGLFQCNKWSHHE